jgi:hypothetical protein
VAWAEEDVLLIALGWRLAGCDLMLVLPPPVQCVFVGVLQGFRGSCMAGLLPGSAPNLLRMLHVDL